MPWVRLDEHALNHVKILALSHGAFRLWVEGLAHCQKHLTDGAISRAALRSFRYAGRTRVEELTASVDGMDPLWCGTDDGFSVHDYLKWNDSRDRVLAEREKAKARLERFRGRVRNAVSNGEQNKDETVYHVHTTTTTPPDKPPGEKRAARLAFAGKRLEVPKFLDEEFVKRLNDQPFDLTGFYAALDQRLTQTGEPWDLKWIRDQFAAESPQPERRRVVYDEPSKPFTQKELDQAREWKRKVGYCPHTPTCETSSDCMAIFIRTRLRLEAVS